MLREAGMSESWELYFPGSLLILVSPNSSFKCDLGDLSTPYEPAPLGIGLAQASNLNFTGGLSL